MDAVTFTQERMKRQIEDLQDKQDRVQARDLPVSVTKTNKLIRSSSGEFCRFP
jgi:hypothetical protein